MDYIEAVAGLFHLQMQVLTMIFRAHFGEEHDLGSLRRWITEICRDSTFWIKDKKKIKDFRACQAFFDHILDGHILAVIAESYNATSCKDLCVALEASNWRNAINKITSNIVEFDLVDRLQRNDFEHRDIPYENAILFVQHGLMYRDFSDAIKMGDSGRVERCLEMFTIWFQATKMHNYASETLHLTACLKKLWSPEFRDFWLKNCIVNSSGKKNGFMPCDLLGEYVVRETKAMIHHNANPKTDNFLRNVIARQVIPLREMRNGMAAAVGATKYHQHSSHVSGWFDIHSVANGLLRNKVFS